MKSRLLLTSFLLCLFSSSIASASLSCPNTSKLSVSSYYSKVTQDNSDENSSFEVVDKGFFGTWHLWVLKVQNITANNKSDAIEKAQSALTNLTNGPQSSTKNSEGTEVCEYLLGTGQNGQPMKATARRATASDEDKSDEDTTMFLFFMIPPFIAIG